MWWSVQNAAYVLGTSRQWVYRLIHNERVQAVRTRAGLLVEPTSVKNLAAARVARAGSGRAT